MQNHIIHRQRRGHRVIWRLFAIAALASSVAQLAISTAPADVGAQPPPEPRWVHLSTTGPADEDKTEMAYDPISEQFILLDSRGKTWTWDGASWTQLSPSNSPGRRYDPAIGHDPVTGQIIIYGGRRVSSGGVSTWLGDTWTWNGSTWQKLSPATSPMACDSTGVLCDSGREFATMAYDPISNQTLLHGGFNGECQSGVCIGQQDDTWAWDGSNWQELAPATVPRGRVGAAMAFDPNRSQVILFGGTDDDCTSCGTRALNDTWAWDGSNWIELSPPTRPSRRDAVSMAYDPHSGNLLLFGGSSRNTLGDTWTWDGSTWTRISPVSRPFPRSGYSIAYNPSTSELLLYGGGTTNIGFGADYGDTWRWGYGTDQVLTVTIDIFGSTNGLPGRWFNADVLPVNGRITAGDPSGITNISCDGATVGDVTGYGATFATGTLTKSAPDGTTLITCTATNGDGVTGATKGSNDRAYVSLDGTLPAITDTGVVSGTPGQNGWYVSPVTHSFSATDPGSAMRSCENRFRDLDGGGYELRADSGSQQGKSVTLASGWCTDQARNRNPGIEPEPYMIDFTGPYDVTFEGGGLTDGASYNAGFVPDGPTRCTAQDDVSQFDNCDLSGYDTSPGPHTIIATAYDVAGNSATAELSYTVVDWTVEMCTNTYSGALTMPQPDGGCPGGTAELEVSAEPALTFCINSYSGQFNWSRSGSCAGSTWPHIVPDDGPLHYCQNLYTGTLRYAPNGQCHAHEVSGAIPGELN